MQPPVGTVTFLFTDIEGSTKLWQEHPAAMAGALSRHHALLHESIAAHDGYVFQIIGDAFCASFSTANDGLEAALERPAPPGDRKLGRGLVQFVCEWHCTLGGEKLRLGIIRQANIVRD